MTGAKLMNLIIVQKYEFYPYTADKYIYSYPVNP